MTIVVRTAGDPGAIASALRSTLTSLDATLPLSNEITMRQVMAISTMPQGVSSVLASAFGALAALLMVVGIFGVTTYVVTQRTQEMGIRLALGASRARVAGLILRQSMTPVALGLAGGVVAALGIARLLSTMLFGVRPWTRWCSEAWPC